MTTFSQMVDDIESEVRRPDLTSDIARYLNQTIRECHFDPETNAVAFFTRNACESRVECTSDRAQVWNFPTPGRFQKLAAAQYESVYDSRGQSIWPTETRPGAHLRSLLHYFYQAGDSYVFSGHGGVGAIINLYWYAFPASLPYFAPNCRPMIYDDYGGKVYDIKWIHEHDRPDADVLTTNWLLQSWAPVVAEGVRAKVYKRVSDTERARTCYSLYAQLRKGLVTSEVSLLYTGG